MKFLMHITSIIKNTNQETDSNGILITITDIIQEDGEILYIECEFVDGFGLFKKVTNTKEMFLKRVQLMFDTIITRSGATVYVCNDKYLSTNGPEDIQRDYVDLDKDEDFKNGKIIYVYPNHKCYFYHFDCINIQMHSDKTIRTIFKNKISVGPQIYFKYS